MDDRPSEPSPGLVPPDDDAAATRTLGLLEHPVRRQLVEVLAELETPERLSALTRSLAATESPAVPDDPDELLIQLYHVHVPKLVDAGAAYFDEDDRRVELTDRGETIAVALDR